MPAHHTPPPRNHADLVAFLAVLAAGVVLVCVARMSPESLAAAAIGLASLYRAWIDRPQRDSHPPAPGRDDDPPVA